MKYNFDEIIDRSGNRSSKYDERIKKFGTADVIPLWVADMDFRTAQPIIDLSMPYTASTAGRRRRPCGTWEGSLRRVW